MNNQQWNNKLLHHYDTLNAHDDINISYANLLDIVYVEMDTHLKVRGKGKRGRQQYKGAYYYNRPYWTKELSEQWRKMKSAEHLFFFFYWNETRKYSIKKRVSITAMEV